MAREITRDLIFENEKAALFKQLQVPKKIPEVGHFVLHFTLYVTMSHISGYK